MVDTFQVVHEMFELLVILVVVEGQNRQPVLQLVAKRIGRVIHNDNILYVPVHQNPQVLDENALFSLNAVLPEEAVGYIFGALVDIVQHNVRVAAVRGCKDDDFEILGQFLQDLLTVRPNIDTRLIV